MRKFEVITLFNANNLPSAKQLALGQLQASLLGSRLTAVLAKSNNSLTHSLYFLIDYKDIERRHLCRRAMAIYGLFCTNAGQAAVFLYPNETNKVKPLNINN